MSDWLMRVIKAEAERLIELAADDDELRADLRALAEHLLAATQLPMSDANRPAQPAPLTATTAPIAGDTSSSRPGTPERIEADASTAGEPLKELTLGKPSPPPLSEPGIVATRSTRLTAARGQVEDLEARCRRKADAARWAAERLRRMREGNSLEVDKRPMDGETIEWTGRITDCLYWLNPAEGTEQADITLLDDLGGCFESMAEALTLVRATRDRPTIPKFMERSLPLLAEAQSALRAAFSHLNAPDDPDQLEIFEWLKTSAARHHVYIKRFMRADDRADPTGWPQLLSRIEALATGDPVSRQVRARIDQLQEHLKQIGSGEASDPSWQVLIGTVDDLIGQGVPPSNREIRELLLPAIEKLPERDDLPAGFRLVLRELDRFLGARPALERSPASQEPAGEVKEVARLLAGRSIVLIGGNRRREAQQSLERSLRLKDLIWIETKEHQAVDAFEPLIAQRDVALVLLAIRWSSHAFGDVKQYCDRHGKPLVRLPGGYSPNQVAAQVLAQCSAQLEER
jgi:hypothetical protein